MCLTIPSLTELREVPELSALVSLRASLEVTEHSLFAVYPELEIDDGHPLRRYHTGREAYACAIIHQLRALSANIDEFIQNLQRIKSTTVDHPRIPF
jgi:hypothetical protein